MPAMYRGYSIGGPHLSGMINSQRRKVCNLFRLAHDMLNNGDLLCQRDQTTVIYSEHLAAFELQDILARERRRIVGLCATLVRNAEAAEDLAQETLYEAWSHRDNLRDNTRFAEWLSGIARNVCLRWLQHRRRDAVHTLPPGSRLDDSKGEAATSLEALPDDLDIEAELERAELAQLLDRAMSRLPAQTRTILRGHFIDEAAHAEIALRLGLSESAVKVRLYRGKRALQRLLLTDFAESVEAYGLASATSKTWEETHMWCSICGKERLQGRLVRDTAEGEFALLCRNCFAQSGQMFHSSGTALLAGVTRFKPALTRIMAWSASYYRAALQDGAAPCLQCGQRGSLSIEQSFVTPAHPHGMRTLVLSCPSCATECTQSLPGLVLSLPQSRAFWRAHPRVGTLPERTVETQGRAAIVTSFRSVTDGAQLDVISALDTFDVLHIHGVAC
jgi:RNA polymerase sigma factor (sigma-70 family)